MPCHPTARFAASFSVASFTVAWLITSSLFTALAAGAAEPPKAAHIHGALASLQAYKFLSSGIEVPAEGLSFTRDTSTWTLSSGTLHLQEPVDGVVTGLIFEGRGHFRMTIPDRYELRQLRRFAQAPELEAFEATFSSLVLRTSEPFALDWLDGIRPAAADSTSAGPYAENALSRDRHEHWLFKRFEDIDARVLLGLHLPGDQFLRIDMETKAHGWLTWQYDALRLEEITLDKFQAQNEFTETWISLDRPEDRRADGRPDGIHRRPVDLEHVSIQADVTARSTRGAAGFSRTALTVGRFVADLSLRPTRDGIAALPLELGRLSRVESVTDGAGRELPFIRARVGELTRSLDERLNDDSLVVFLSGKTAPGTPVRLFISYQTEIFNYVSGRRWYPSPPDSIDDMHTAELRITARVDSEVRAIGSLKEKVDGDNDSVTWVYEMNQPTKMHGFSFADRFVEAEIESEGIPKVISFSPPVSNRSKKMARSVGTDIANSLHFFQWLFASELPVDEIYATGIAARHGQAFEGFLHLGEITYAQESTNTSELFRSHEVAHQWWGHRVGWNSYRDQWLSEAFAEYSSMMFVEATAKKGDRLFADILKAYSELLLGERIANFNRFVRPWLSGVDSKQRQRLGPIGHGYRASNAEMPQGYTLQNYYKGPMVLHMLRHLLKRPEQGDTLFVAVLRDFIATHSGDLASTEDFRRIVEKHAGGDWTWFFDQWIYGTAIPSYTWSYDVSEEGGQVFIDLTVEQEQVPPGFTMPVPLRLEWGDGQRGRVQVTVDQPRQTFRLPVPAKPKKVELNPDYAVLARVKKG